MRHYHTIGLSVAIAALLCTSAAAADVSPLLTPEKPQAEAQGDDWLFTSSPYFWAAGLSGKTAQFGLPSVKVNADFTDILSNLDFAFMTAAELRHERLSFFGDFMYVKLSVNGDTPRGILATDVTVTAKTLNGLLGVGYAVVDDPSGHLDVVAGVRLWSVDTTLSFNGGRLDGREADDSATWVDGMVGLRGQYFITPEWYLSGWGLAGTGGANIDWDVAAVVGYQFTDSVSATAGYRALGVNYRNDGFVFDVVQQGPILSLAVKF